MTKIMCRQPLLRFIVQSWSSKKANFLATTFKVSFKGPLCTTMVLCWKRNPCSSPFHRNLGTVLGSDYTGRGGASAHTLTPLGFWIMGGSGFVLAPTTKSPRWSASLSGHQPLSVPETLSMAFKVSCGCKPRPRTITMSSQNAESSEECRDLQQAKVVASAIPCGPLNSISNFRYFRPCPRNFALTASQRQLAKV